MTQNDPLFREMFGAAWELMPNVFHRHYANRPYHMDVVTVTGTMSVWQSPLMRPFAFLFLWTGTLVPVTEANILTDVIFKTHSDTSCFLYDRRFKLGDNRILTFKSRLEPRNGNEAVEWTESGIGWHCAFFFEGGRVRLRHLGYRFKIGALELPLPMDWLFGRPSAWEEAVSETEFRMEMTIDHPIFGRIYSYSGQFKVTDIELEQ